MGMNAIDDGRLKRSGREKKIGRGNFSLSIKMARNLKSTLKFFFLSAVIKMINQTILNVIINLRISPRVYIICLLLMWLFSVVLTSFKIKILLIFPPGKNQQYKHFGKFFFHFPENHKTRRNFFFFFRVDCLSCLPHRVVYFKNILKNGN